MKSSIKKLSILALFGLMLNANISAIDLISDNENDKIGILTTVNDSKGNIVSYTITALPSSNSWKDANNLFHSTYNLTDATANYILCSQIITALNNAPSSSSFQHPYSYFTGKTTWTVRDNHDMSIEADRTETIS